MAGGHASLVLASCPSAARPDGPILTDDPAWIRDRSRDVLLDDLLLADRYAQRRYDAARDAFLGDLPGPFPADAVDYAYAFIQAHVDLSVRVERVMMFLERERPNSLSIPEVSHRWAWAAAEAARRLGIASDTYPAGGATAGHGGSGRSRVARIALRVLGPILRIRYRHRPLRVLTTDLGLLDAILPHFERRVGILSPGLGIAERALRRSATFAWIRHSDIAPIPSLGRAMDLREAARVLAIQDGGPLPELVPAFREAFSSGSVDAVVLSDDKAPLNHACVRLAAEASVPSLVVQHGITGHPVGFLPIEATRFATWGRACSDWLTAHGAESAVLVPTGDPRFDRLFRDRAALREQARSRLATGGIARDAKLAVFFSQPVEGRTEAFRIVLDATAFAPLRVLTKIHPAEDAAFYRGIAEQRGLDAFVVAGAPESYLCAADAVITQSSGLAAVAAQAGIPTILLEPVALENIQAYDARWPRATDAPSLHTQLESILRGTYDRERLCALGEEYGGPADGRAGERVARVVEGMVKAHG